MYLIHYYWPDCISAMLPQVWWGFCVCGRWWRLQTANHLGAWGYQLPERRWGEMPWSIARGSTGHSSPSLPSSSVSCSTRTSTRVTKTQAWRENGGQEKKLAGWSKGNTAEGKEEKGNKPSRGGWEWGQPKKVIKGSKNRQTQSWSGTNMLEGKLPNFLLIGFWHHMCLFRSWPSQKGSTELRTYNNGSKDNYCEISPALLSVNHLYVTHTQDRC